MGWLDSIKGVFTRSDPLVIVDAGPGGEPPLGPGKHDHVFHRLNRYHQITKPEGAFESHTKGEGSDSFVIIRCLDGAMPEQHETVEVDEDERMCTPEGYVPHRIMKLLKADMHVRRYKPLWGFERELEGAEEHPAERHPENAVGLIGPVTIKGGRATAQVTLYLPKGEKRDEHTAANMQKALTFSKYLEAEDLVKSVQADLAGDIDDYDREAVRLTFTANLKTTLTGKMPMAWRGKRKAVERRRCLKLRQEFIDSLDVAHRVRTSVLKNIYEYTWAELADAFETGSDGDHEAEVKLRDVRRNAVLQVGTLFPFATITAAIGAAASGDVIEVHATAGNTYTENVTTGALTGIHIYSVVPNQAISIAGVGGAPAVTLGGVCYISNFTVVPPDAATRGVQLGGNNSRALGCIVVGGSDGFFVNTTGCEAFNCLAYGSVRGFNFWLAGAGWTTHCTAVNCTTAGFDCSLGVARAKGVACLASDNAVDYLNPLAADCTWNASSDLTAPGASPQTGFVNTDFVNYAGNDFRLRAAVKATTQARFDGWPVLHDDAFCARRSKSLTGASVFFAGYHHPITIPAGLAATNPTTDGDLDVTWTNAADYTDDEMVFVYDGNSGALLGRLQADLGTGRITGLTNGTLYTLIGRATGEGIVVSDESNIAAAMPLAGGGPPHIRVFDRTMLDVQG